MKVYFMYNYLDAEFAEEKVKELKESGLDVFRFSPTQNIKNWKSIARKKIKECNFICYYFNGDAFLKRNKNIIWEYRTALRYNKKVIFIDGNHDTPVDTLIKEENRTLLKKLFNESYDTTTFEMPLNPFDKAQSTLISKSQWSADNQVVHESYLNKEIPSSEFYSILMEQYKLMVETSETLISRRQTTSNVYIGIISALLSLVGTSLALPSKLATSIIFFVVGIITIVLSINWKIMLQNYNKNNEGKFAVINAIEKKLPANMFDSEYNYNKLKSIVSYASREITLCNIFAIIGSIIATTGIVLLVLSLCGILQ